VTPVMTDLRYHRICRGARVSASRSLTIRCAIVAAWAVLAGGCSVSLPIASLLGESVETTSSIVAKPVSPLSPELGPEDWRRARGALAVALDPTGNGAAVTWDNPETALKGAFAPVGLPFVRNDEICRAFLANLDVQGNQSQLQGAACRPSGGEWLIKDVRPWKKPI
jgi:surface antigen